MPGPDRPVPARRAVPVHARPSQARPWLALSVALILAAACGGSSSSGGGGGGDDGGGDPTTGGRAALVEGVALLEPELALPGLEGRVDVIRDVYGIHHIFARDAPLDAAFANGYLQARERLFQMDFLRKVAQGRLTELLGTLDPSVLSTSVFLRTIFTTTDGRRIEDLLIEELAAVDPAALALIQRYCDGVNAYLADLAAGANGAVQPQQYRVIDGLFSLGSDYTIEPWEPRHVLLLGRLQQWDLSNTMGEEVSRLERLSAIEEAEAAGRIPVGTAADTIRAQPVQDAFVIPPDERDRFVSAAARAAATAARVTPAAAPAGEGRMPSRDVLRAIARNVAEVRRLSPFGREDRGSNNWIVSGRLTQSGHAMLANDPHLALGNPSTFYFVHLDQKTFAGGRINAHGAGFPGLPGILLGQNETLAWGGTVANYDVTDVYVEQISGSGAGRTVTFNGGQVPVLRIQERFQVRQVVGRAQTVTVPIDIVPHHGPQVPDPDPTDDVVGLASVDGMTFRWTGGEVTRDLLAFLGLMEAETIDDFFNELLDFGVGAQNFVGADSEGNIGYFPHALIPRRQAGALSLETPPWLPLPGTGGYEWLGGAPGQGAQFLSSEEIPQSRNPARGWIVTANNEQLGTIADNDPLNDGIYLGFNFTEGNRAGRASQLIEQRLANGPMGFVDMVEIQDDHTSLFGLDLKGRLLVALDDPAALGDAPNPEGLVGQARAALDRWSGDCPIGTEEPFTGRRPSDREANDSVGCTIFHLWASYLPHRLLGDEMARAGVSTPSVRDTLTIVQHLLEDVAATDLRAVATLGPAGRSVLFDDLDTPGEEGINRTFVLAMSDAVQEGRRFFGTGDLSLWRWGRAHTSTFEDLALGSILPIFNLPSAAVTGSAPAGYARPGGLETVDPANFGGCPPRPEPCLPFEPGSGPVMRHVIELTPDGTTAVNVLPGGQNDTDPDAGLFDPVEVKPEIHYGDQLPLWLRNDRREQWITVEDVVAGAEGRIRMAPRAGS